MPQQHKLLLQPLRYTRSYTDLTYNPIIMILILPTWQSLVDLTSYQIPSTEVLVTQAFIPASNNTHSAASNENTTFVNTCSSRGSLHYLSQGSTSFLNFLLFDTKTVIYTEPLVSHTVGPCITPPFLCYIVLFSLYKRDMSTIVTYLLSLLSCLLD